MLNIKRIDKTSNQRVYEMVNRWQLTLQVQQRQLRFVGHCLGRDENDLINKYFFYGRQMRVTDLEEGKATHTVSPHQYIGKLINKDTPPKVNEMRKAATSGPPDQVADC
jgi:hypothetical protein